MDGRRREPKGTPRGGRFAKGPSGGVDASDLAETDFGGMFDGVDWTDAGVAPGGSRRFREVRGPEGARLFHDRIAELKRSNPFAAAVDVHSAEEYAHCRLFLTGNGRAGFALADGDMLVSVFSYRGEHAGDDIVAKAVEQGARRLDCYNIRGGLPRLYGRHGFKPVATVDWNDDYAPDGWDYGTFGRPDVMAMAVTDDTPEPVGHVDYDTAVRLAADVARGGRRSDA